MTEDELMSRFCYAEYLSPEEYTEEIVRNAIKKNYNFYLNMSEAEQQKYKMILLEVHPQKTDGFSKEELLSGIRKNPQVFEHLSKEQVDKELLYCYLEQLVRTTYKPNCYYWSNVPSELMDKVYYQSRAMAEPFYLHQVPKEYMSQKLINYSFEHMFDKGGCNYTKPLEILSSSKEFLTEEMVLECCKRHFAGVEKIANEYKNDTFYRKLMDAGMYEFICVVDLKTISKELLLECMQKMKRTQFHFWQDKKPKDFWTAELASEYARISNLFFDDVPKKMITKEMALTNMVHHRTFEKMPKEFIDDEVIDLLMNNSYGMISKIPEKYLTDEFFDKYISLRKIYFKDIPKEKLTPEVVMDYIRNECSVDFSRIPMNIITQEMINELAEKNICYHFDQGHQTPEISEWIYFAHKRIFMSGNYVCKPSNYLCNDDWRVNMKHKIYMYNHVTDVMIEDMLTYLSPSTIASSLLAHNRERYSNVYEKLFAADPSCMVKFPEVIKETYRCRLNEVNEPKESEAKAEVVVKEINDTVPDVLFETFEQLSLFDFLNAS